MRTKSKVLKFVTPVTINLEIKVTRKPECKYSANGITRLVERARRFALNEALTAGGSYYPGVVHDGGGLKIETKILRRRKTSPLPL